MNMVCDSTRGIGKATAHEVAALAATVVLLARNEDRLAGFSKELPTPHGQRHEYLVADFSTPDQVELVITQFARESTAHILINNTGGPPGGDAIDAEPEAFIKAFQAHLICNQILVRALVPGMKKERYGRIINIISTSVKMPIRGLGVSNTIRGAVGNWAKTLSFELGSHGITVNNVLPGATETDRLEEIMRATAEKSGKRFEEVRDATIREIPVGRLASPHEVAAAAAFLATPAAAFINGINLPVDGGRTGCL